jgi:hypothetical protein
MRAKNASFKTLSFISANNRRCGTSHDPVRCTSRHYSMSYNLKAAETMLLHATHVDHLTSTTAPVSKQIQRQAIQ